MDDPQQRAFASYRNIVHALAGRAASLTPEILAVVERLSATVDAIDKCWIQQKFVTRCHVMGARRQLDRMRQDMMVPLARLARVLFAGEPGIQEALRVPHKRVRAEDILESAERMVEALRPHRALLAASHIDSTRIDHLQVETRRLKKVFDKAHATVADRAVPTRRLPKLFASAHADVLVLDALMPALFKTSGDLVFWKFMRRVNKRMGRPRASRRGKRADRQAAT